MRRTPIRFLLGFLLVVLVAEVGARVLMETSTSSLRWYDDTAALKIEALDERGQLDVVFAGTSMAWQAFVPRVHLDATGEAGYNVGLAGGTPEVMDRWLTEEVEPRAHPSTVVWGMSSFDFAPNYGADNAEAYDSAAATSEGLLNGMDRSVSGVSTLIAERSLLRDPRKLWGSGRDERDVERALAERDLGPDGERLDFRPDIGAERRRVMQARLADFEIDDEDVATIEQTIGKLAEKGVEVILVELPVPARFIELHPNGVDDHALVGAALSSIAERTGSRFLRLAEGYSNDYFTDFTHLDPEGVAKFMDEFEAAYLSDRDDAGTVAEILVDDVDSTSEDCETETIVDEYGFEIEVCIEKPSSDRGDPAASTTGALLVPSNNDLGFGVYEAILDAALRPCSSKGSNGGGLSALPVDEQATVDHLLQIRDGIAAACEALAPFGDRAAALGDLARFVLERKR